MSGRAAGGQDRGDDGSVEPAVRAVLAAYAAGSAGERDVLTVLAASRLLMPLVTVPTAAGEAPAAAGGSVPAGSGHGHPPAVQAGARPASAGQTGRNRSEMAVPTLVGRDGRHAVLAFTCLDALTRWRADARPVPVPAAQVWQAGVQDASAVVIDIAGPVPMVVDGARLAALADGRAVPAAHEDPGLLAGVQSALASEPAIAGARLRPATEGGDLMLHLTVAPGHSAGDPVVEAAAERAAGALMAAAAGRLRRGIEVALTGNGP